MIREVMQGAQLWQLPVIALILFFVAALGIGLYLLRKGARAEYDERAEIPFVDEHEIREEEKEEEEKK